MQIKSTLELTMGLDTDEFRKILNKTCGRKRLEGDEFTDYSLASEGITVKYRNSQYKKKITLVIDPNCVLNGDDLDGNISKFTRKLDAAITDYFNNKFDLEEFNLTKVILAADINLRSRGKVADYLKVLQRLGRVKGFTPSNSKEFDEETYFWLKGNSNGTEFILYDLEEMLKAELQESDVNRKKPKRPPDNQ